MKQSIWRVGSLFFFKFHLRISKLGKSYKYSVEFSSATYGDLQCENFKSLKFQETGFKSKYSSRSNSSVVEGTTT